MTDVEPESLVALGLVLLKQLQPYIQELQDVAHIDRFEDQNLPVYEDAKLAPGLEGRNVTLKQREEDNKLSFKKKFQS